MPVQNSNSKISAQLLIYFKSLHQLHDITLCVKEGSLHNRYDRSRRCFVRNRFGFYPLKGNTKILHRNFFCPKRKFPGNYLSKRQAKQVLAKSLCTVQFEILTLPMLRLLSSNAQRHKIIKNRLNPAILVSIE